MTSWASTTGDVITRRKTSLVTAAGRLSLRKQELRIHVRRESHGEESDHHLFPALVAPFDDLGGIGIVRIVRRIIEMRHARYLSAFRQQNVTHRLVPKLPAEIVTGHAQNGLCLTGPENQAVLEIL